MIRDAATVIALRDATTRPRVLMGRRGSGAIFMPRKIVFPGGAVDPSDARIPLAGLPPEPCRARLGDRAAALAAAAVREFAEETGLCLGVPGAVDLPAQAADDSGWRHFAAAGLCPDASALRFVFRAITPPGRTRRFDARFFLVDAGRIAGDPDDLSGAGDELSDLGWIALDALPLPELPVITQVVLDAVAARLPGLDAPDTVPFFQGGDEAARRPRTAADTPRGPQG